MVRTIKGVSYGLLCFLAGAALVLLAGASSTQEDPSGRYQVSATTGGAYILDTQTGHLWARPSIGALSYDLGTLEHPLCEMVKP
jgi:hypothetical protein